MVKTQAGQGEGDRPLKLSREKILHLSHLILDHLNQDDGVEFFDEPQEIRGEIVKIIMDEMKTDEAIDALVRRRSRRRSADRRGLGRVGRALPQVLRGRVLEAPEVDAVAFRVSPVRPPVCGRPLDPRH